MRSNDTKSKTKARPHGASREGASRDRGTRDRVARDRPGKDRPVANNLSGRVKHDDRGNAVWEWATSDALAGNSTQGLQKLHNSSLALADDVPPPSGAAKANPLGTVKGYSPYDSGVLAKAQAPRRKKDLRKLSEWVKLKKQFAAKTPD